MIDIIPINEVEGTFDLIEKLTTLLQQLSSNVTSSLVQNAIRSSQSYILIAKDTETGKMVGTATLGYLHCVTGTRAHIEDVVVDIAYRGRGIATLLIEGLIERAKEIKAKSIDLTSRPEREAANQLYRKLGFVVRETNVYRYQPIRM